MQLRERVESDISGLPGGTPATLHGKHRHRPRPSAPARPPPAGRRLVVWPGSGGIVRHEQRRMRDDVLPSCSNIATTERVGGLAPNIAIRVLQKRGDVKYVARILISPEAAHRAPTDARISPRARIAASADLRELPRLGCPSSDTQRLPSDDRRQAVMLLSSPEGRASTVPSADKASDTPEAANDSKRPGSRTRFYPSQLLTVALSIRPSLPPPRGDALDPRPLRIRSAVFQSYPDSPKHRIRDRDPAGRSLKKNCPSPVSRFAAIAIASHVGRGPTSSRRVNRASPTYGLSPGLPA